MLQSENSTIGVVHLVWIPYGIEIFKRFIDSYQTYPSGYNHTLHILFNGYKVEEDVFNYENHLISKKIEYRKHLLKKGQDIDAYKWIASIIPEKYLLFLNSYSIILAPNWLEKIISPLVKNPKIGAVGATGSLQSYVNTVFVQNNICYDKTKKFRDNFRKYKLFIKSIFYYSLHFQLFPNVHIRTNSFAIRKCDFLNLHFNRISKKYDAYRFESGRNGMSQQLIKSGLLLRMA